MKILITGAGGFIGSNLVKFFSKKNYDIIAFDNNTRGNLKRIRGLKNVKLINVDVTNINLIRKHFEKFDMVFHLAALNGTSNFYNFPEKVLNIGLIGTHNLIQISKEFQVKKFIFASSSEVYHNPKIIPTDEYVELKIPNIFNPRFSYSLSKIVGEGLVVNSFRNTNTDFLIFRPHNIIGPEMGFEHVIPNIIQKLSLQKQKNNNLNKFIIEIQGSGNETRSFMYIDDFVRALSKLSFSKLKNEIVNIGNDKEIKIKELLKIISNTLKINIKFTKTDPVLGSPKRRSPNVNKLKKINFNSRNSVSKSIQLTAKWYWNFYEKSK